MRTVALAAPALLAADDASSALAAGILAAVNPCGVAMLASLPCGIGPYLAVVASSSGSADGIRLFVAYAGGVAGRRSRYADRRTDLGQIVPVEGTIMPYDRASRRAII